MIVQLQLCKERYHTLPSRYRCPEKFCPIPALRNGVQNFSGKLYKFILLPVLAVLLLCSSCMQGEPSTASEANRAGASMADVAVINVDMYDNYYGEASSNLTNPPVWTVQTGADVVATLANHGRRNHNWAIVKSGVAVPIPYEEGQGGGIILHGIGMVYGNSQTTMTFTAPEAGEYLVICTVSGHYPEMQGRLLVTPP